MSAHRGDGCLCKRVGPIIGRSGDRRTVDSRRPTFPAREYPPICIFGTAMDWVDVVAQILVIWAAIRSAGAALSHLRRCGIGLSVHDRRAREGGSSWWEDQRLWRVGAARHTVGHEVVAMVVAIACGGVLGSAWLVADRCRLGARLLCLAPVPGIPCGRRGAVGLGSAGRPSLAPAGAPPVRPRRRWLGRLSG